MIHLDGTPPFPSRLTQRLLYRPEEREIVQAESRVELDVYLYHYCILERMLRPHSASVPSEVAISDVGHRKDAFRVGRTPLDLPIESQKLTGNLRTAANPKLWSGSFGVLTVSFSGVKRCHKCDDSCQKCSVELLTAPWIVTQYSALSTVTHSVTQWPSQIFIQTPRDPPTSSIPDAMTRLATPT